MQNWVQSSVCTVCVLQTVVQKNYIGALHLLL